MSRENVERVRQSIEVVNRTHGPDVDFMVPDFEWHTRADLPDPAVYRGPDGAARLIAEWNAAFDDLKVDIEELIDAGDRVVAVLRLHGRLRDSGDEVEMAETHVVTVRNGKAILLREYKAKEEALQAEGLEG
jgi:ketosteroid isomerase-like protein